MRHEEEGLLTLQVTTQPTQGLLCTTRKVKMADDDLDTRRGASDKLTATSSVPEQSRDGDATSSTQTMPSRKPPQLIFSVLPMYTY